MIAAAVGLLWATAAQADVNDWSDLMRDEGLVVDQQPTQGGGPGSDTAFRNDWGFSVWQQVADNILLTEPATIQHVNWWGFYGGDDDEEPEPAPDEETMRIRFYAARDGDDLPGDILFEQSLLNPSRIATGRTIATGPRPPEYLYGADLSQPVALEADTPYWLEIVQIDDLESCFRWESGFGSDGSHVFLNQNVSDWHISSGGSLAFVLSTVPEPGVALVLGIGLLLALRTPCWRLNRISTLNLCHGAGSRAGR